MTSISILGAGKVGSALGLRWADEGHKIVFGVRDPSDAQYDSLKGRAGLTVVGLPQAAQSGAYIVLATPWHATLEIIRTLGDLTGKTIIDCTNPVTFGEAGVALVDTGGLSAAERIAAAAPRAYVFKTLNQVGANVMEDPSRFNRSPMMFVAGDNDARKTVVSELVASLGFDVRDAGPLGNARALEALAWLWIDQASRGPLGRDFVFAIAALGAPSR